MKGRLIVLIGTVFWASYSGSAYAQSDEAAQLLLNVEKLAQFKQILSDLKKGYTTIHKGYSTIKDISEGNFKLHEVFLDGLLSVSPEVRRYKRIGDIISSQLLLVREYKEAAAAFARSGQFSAGELQHIGSVHQRLVSESLHGLDELTMVVTSGEMRMSDQERLAAIDRIFRSIADQLGFLRRFNSAQTMLGLQREREQRDVDEVKKMYGIKN